jgi:hypothetical protein
MQIRLLKQFSAHDLTRTAFKQDIICSSHNII